jgi:hypothetical protein
MFRRWRLKRVHAAFLESCRGLEDSRAYWDGLGRARRAFLQLLIPMPLLGLHADGALILEALRALEETCRSDLLTEDVLRKYHAAIMGTDEGAGVYRKNDASVFGSKRAGAAPGKIPALMKQLDFRIREVQKKLDQEGPRPPEEVLRSATELYHRIGFIHPFSDGNGRVARLAMNHLLRRYEAPYVILPPVHESLPLWNALEEANQGRPEGLLEVALACRHAV